MRFLSRDHPNLPPTLRLLSGDRRLPQALNSHLLRFDFDPDFVAALISRQSGEALVDILLDADCTFSITPDRKDFIEYHEGSFGSVQTVNGPTLMAGYGLVRWTLISENGDHLHLTIPCHHVPASKIRLLSPQEFCQHNGFDRSKDQFGGNSNYFWMHADHNSTRFQCPIDPRSHLPIALAKTPCHLDGCCSAADQEPSPCTSCHHRHGITNMSVFDETNQNISATQKELLL